MDSGFSFKHSGEGLDRRIPVRDRVTCGPLSILEMIRASDGCHANTPGVQHGQSANSDYV